MPGAFVWVEWMGADLAGAADFYGHVLGWSVADSGMTDFEYRIGSTQGVGVAGLFTTPPEAKGAPTCWTGYLRVEDVDVAFDHVTAGGGHVLRPPWDIPNVGRVAMVTDPQGAPFALFREAGGAMPPLPLGTPGKVGWRELRAAEGESALQFYAEQFGWREKSQIDMGPMGVYRIFEAGDEDGGVMTKLPQMPGPHWMFYFNAESADAAAARVTEKGGTVLNGPMEVPGGGWTVTALDREGAPFGLFAPKR